MKTAPIAAHAAAATATRTSMRIAGGTPRAPFARLLLVGLTGIYTLGTACAKSPVDVALDAALDFSGFFKASDGTEIELVPVNNGGEAYVRKAGSILTSLGIAAGDRYMIGMAPAAATGEYTGSIIGRSRLYGHGTVTVRDGSLSVVWRGDSFSGAKADPIAGHESWTRVSQLSGAGPGAGGSNPTTASACKAYWLPILANNGPWKATKAVRFQTGVDAIAPGHIKDWFLSATTDNVITEENKFRASDGTYIQNGPRSVTSEWTYWSNVTPYNRGLCRFLGMGYWFPLSFADGTLTMSDTYYEVTFQKR